MDINYLLFLQNLREATGNIFTPLMEYITKLGETSVLMFVIGIIYWCFDKKKGVFLMFTLYANRVINGFIKITACVYRPWIKDPRITPVPEAQADATGYSFPSGHTGNAVSIWGGCALDTGGKAAVHKVIKAILIILVLLIAFSRNYLGVHTPQDVVVALVIGTAVLFAMAKLMPLIEERPNGDIWALSTGLAVCVILILYAALKSYPVDYAQDGSVIVEGSKMAVDSFKTAGGAMGMLVGWFIEKRFIKFSTDIGNKERIVRALICFFIYSVLDSFASPAADMIVSAGLSTGAAKAIMQFVVLLYFTAGAPAVSKILSHFFNKE